MRVFVGLMGGIETEQEVLLMLWGFGWFGASTNLARNRKSRKLRPQPRAFRLQ